MNNEIESLRLKIKQLEAKHICYCKIERRLQQSEQKYRTIFENTGTATIVIRDDTIIEMVNSEFEKLVGIKREDVEGLVRWTEFIEKDDLKRMLHYHRMRRQDNASAPRNYRCNVINNTGELRTCFTTAAIIPGTNKSIASFIDISDTIWTKKALKDSEKKYIKKFSSSNDGIIITSLYDGTIVDANDNFLNMTEYTREQVIGYTIKSLKILPDSLYRKRLIKMLIKERKFDNQEITFRRHSGKLRIAKLSAEIINLQNREFVLSTLSDITKQRYLEREILQISERERRQIGHDLHDDLGQHLIGIDALSALLQHRLEQTGDPKAMIAKEISLLIREAISKAKSLARGLCPVNIDHGGLLIALHDLAVHIKKVFGIFCILDYDKNIEIEDSSVAMQLYHIVQESIDNVIRHGKVRQIVISLTSKNDIITLSIKDNGITDNIRTIESKKELGLNIIKYRAKRIGATLEVMQKTDGGTKILCVLNRKF